MQRFTRLFVLVFIAFPIFVSCNQSGNSKIVEGNHRIINRLIDVCDFNEIKMDCIGEIIYTQIPEDEAYFQITTDENILPYLNMKVENNCLIISRNDTIITPSKLTIYTNSKGLNKITLNDSASIKLAGEVNAKRMNICIAGQAKVSMDSLFCREIIVDVAEYGAITLVGASNFARFLTRGNGAIASENFLVEHSEILENEDI
jgi:hypothetical protein